VKIGTENRTKTILAAVLLIFAAVMLYRWLFPGADEAATATPSTVAPTTVASPSSAPKTSNPRPARRGGPLLAQTLDPTLRFDLLKSSEDVAYKGSGRDIFRSQPEPPPIPKPLPMDTQPTPVYTPPPPPPINLKFYGFANSKDGNKRIFLSQGEDIFVAKEGQVIDRRYRIVKINPSSVDVEDVLTNNRQTLPLVAG
jgi:hypothetical protein